MTAKKDAKKRRLAAKRKRQAHGRDGHAGVLHRIKRMPAFRDADVRMMPAGAQKMSQVILEFAEPLLEQAEGDTESRNALAFAVLAWNASFMPEDRRQDLVEEHASAFARAGGDIVAIREVFSELIRRKEEVYADVHRLILGYHVKGPEGRRSLEVVSTMANVAS
jgi:hypothetical protein